MQLFTIIIFYTRLLSSKTMKRYSKLEIIDYYLIKKCLIDMSKKICEGFFVFKKHEI